jgi:hypothetical protein
MKTTVDIPREQLEEAIRWSGAHTKREAVLVAITDFNRRKRLERLVRKLGTFEHVMTAEELDQMRRTD